MENYIFSTVILLLIATNVASQQFGLSGELRPRFEARHGYKTLASPDQDAALFVSQRARLNLNYSAEKFKVRLVIQNVSVWGDVSTLSYTSKNGFAFHEVWGEYFFTPRISMKLGRQEISYDDQRMFGAVNWAQQARSFDAFLLKFKTGERGKFDVGFAFNANKETLFAEDYTVDQFKSLQYAWYHNDFNDAMGLSLLFLNNGMPYNEVIDQDNTKQKTAYSQTLGGRFTYIKGIFDLNAASYFQTGSTPNGTKDAKVDLSAYYFTANLNFKVVENFSIGVGTEYLSGNDQGSTSSKNNAFNPFYGTNHKFNGLMDYFYVGNHISSVGLIDLYVPLKYSKNKFSISLVPHFFSADGTILNSDNTKAESYLGTEIDISAGYKIIKSVSINAGYSQMFATESMEMLKGGSKDEINNWGWVMVAFKPNFFTKEFKKQNK